MAHLRHRARENLKRHIQQTILEEYQKACNTLNQVLRITWSIVGKTADERVRLQALALIDQCNSHKMDMVTNGAIVSDALKYVNGKNEKLVRKLVPKQSEEEEDYQTNVSAETEETTN
jgi:hypothetical protein